MDEKESNRKSEAHSDYHLKFVFLFARKYTPAQREAQHANKCDPHTAEPAHRDQLMQHNYAVKNDDATLARVEDGMSDGMHEREHDH
eukprot:CAMPEP_0184379722 /NCGR_PEP_ID=MMETSP0007-20130409/4107_1 /TAXON_ID=97485 /ORGANISM="Prymnesium parvum, Strain Texoma1" /LENGTH=86 /DNA_ID=CAMNT_0026724561 /DNA_START=301 /DNA_END=561 /DNA_ORIENTATION=+